MPQGDYITTKATLTTEIPDPQPANNVAALKVFITAGGEVSVAVQAPKGPWQVGSKFDATFSIHNAGPYRTPVRFHSGLLRGLRSDGWPKGCTAEHGQMWCYDFIVIDAGKTFSFTVHFEVGEYDKNGARLNPQLNLVAPDADLTNNEAAYRAEIIKPSASPTPTGGTGGGGPTLPITGTATTPLALAGLVLLLAGAAAILLTRRRVREGLRTGLTSRTGVPSSASRSATRRRRSPTSSTVTWCRPIGLGRSGERVLNTPVSGRDRSSRGCTRRTPRSARSSHVSSSSGSPGRMSLRASAYRGSKTSQAGGDPSSPCLGAVAGSFSGDSTRPTGLSSKPAMAKTVREVGFHARCPNRRRTLTRTGWPARARRRAPWTNDGH
nr:hypothetical protein GCM10020092_075040 [Actinoplanes digitatis]